MSVIVDQRLSSNIQDIANFEGKFSEGDVGELRLYLTENLTDEQLKQLTSDIQKRGCTLTELIKQDAKVLVIHFVKLSNPLIAITDSLASQGIKTVGWQIIKDTMNVKLLGLPLWLWGIGGIGIISMVMLSRNK